MNTYAEEYFESVDKIDDYTIRIVGKRPSWRPLYDYSLFPMPKHTTVLDDTWVQRTNNEPPLAIGPYVISDMKRGESVTFKRTPNWWGDKKRYFIGQYNFDQITLRVIPPGRDLDYLRQGELDMMVEPSVKNWHEIYTFPAVNNGWIRRARVFLDTPAGVGGFQMNLEAPIFQNKDFRTAMQYLINFDRLNKNLWYSEYFRVNSFFEGTDLRQSGGEGAPVRSRQGARISGEGRLSSARKRGGPERACEAVQRRVRHSVHAL